MRELLFSIIILCFCCFALGFFLAVWARAKAEQKRQERYYAECMRDFYRSSTDEQWTKDEPGF